MERSIKEQVGAATWQSWPVGARMAIADAQATIAALQARVQELEQWVQDQSTANLETMRHTDEMQSRAMEAEQQLTQRTVERDTARRRVDELEAREVDVVTLREDLEQRTAELERVSLLSSHNERRFEEVDKKYKGLHSLIKALPRMEGDVEVYHHESGLRHSVVARPANKYYSSFDTPEEAGAYAAILKHRQGMEG